MTAFERQVAGRLQHHAGPVGPVDDLAVLESVTAASRSPERGFTMSSIVRFVVAGVIVALFGGFLLAGLLTTPQRDDTLPAAVTGSPSPTPTEELLSGMLTEEVEPGVFHVLNDGVRDLTSADHWVVFTGQDGSIWLDYSGDLARLGVSEAHDLELGERDYLDDIELAPDGTVWAVVVKDDESTLRDEWTDLDESTLRSFDGETWTTHRTVDMRYGIGDVEIASNGVVWAALGDGSLAYLDADGSTWQTIDLPTTLRPEDRLGYGFIAAESGVWLRYNDGVWHYADGAWEDIPYRDPRTTSMPDSVFWGIGMGDGGSDETLYRHDGAGWQQWSLKEQRMLAGWGIDPNAVAPDGSFWTGWVGRGALGSPGGCLGISRFDGQTWTRYLPGMCVPSLGMDIAPDGSVWVHAWDREDEGDLFAGPGHLYVITPEAVSGT